MTARSKGERAVRSGRARSRAKRAPGRKRRGRKQRSTSRGFWAAVAVAGLGLLAPVGGLFCWASLPGPGSGRPVHVHWPALQRSGEAGRLLSERGLITSPRLFALYLWLVGGCQNLEPGPHLLNDSLAPRTLLQRLARSPSRPKVRVTIPEGYNHFQIAERLEEKQICSSRAFRRTASARRLLSELGIRGATVEGYLFPATYQLNVDTHPRQMIRVLVAEMRQRLERLGRSHAGALARLRREHNWGERQVLILASIVEKEARAYDERATIASVYFNRLTDPEFVPPRRLQADPTAAYGCVVAPDEAPSCTGFDGRVTPAMLRDPQNRYNTYKHDGLPPSPIANPGEGSIEAVLAPDDTDYLFFVAKRDGRHTFSRSYAEHSRAVRVNRRD